MTPPNARPLALIAGGMDDDGRAPDLAAPLIDRDAETAVLGACFLDPAAVIAAREALTADDFGVAGHRALFRAIGTAFAADGDVDPVTVAAALGAGTDDERSLDAAGGRRYLDWLLDSTPTAANVMHHVRIVRDLARRRATRAVLRRISDELGEPGADVAAIAARAVTSLLPAAGGTGKGKGFQPVRGLVMDAMTVIAARSRGETADLIRTGLPELDGAPLYGVEPGDLVTLLLVSGHGKTALQLSIARLAMERAGVACAFVSAEMAGAQLANRLLSSWSGIDFGRLRKGIFEPGEGDRLADAAAHVAALPFFVDDTPAPKLDDVLFRCRALKLAHPEIRILFVDYVQLLSADAETRTLQIASIANGLKALAKELGVVVIQSAQPDARTVDRRPAAERMPGLDDVMWGQDIRLASDIVITGYRPGLYDQMGEDDAMLLRIAKSRGSALADFSLRWIGPTMTAWSPTMPGPYARAGRGGTTGTAHPDHFTAPASARTEEEDTSWPI